MTPVLAVAALSLGLQQPPQAAAPDSAGQLLAAAVAHMNARRPDSAAILLRRVAEVPNWPVGDRALAWVMLSVVDYQRSGDSAATYALRQALTLDPQVQVPALERNYPNVARILAAERAALAPASAVAAAPVDASPATAAPVPDTAQSATDQPTLLDCLTKCTAGGRAPYVISFPNMQFSSGNAGVGVYERRLRSFLTFQAVIGADGIVEPATVQVSGGSARGMETDLRGALAQARFAPGRLNGVPTRTRVTLRFDFEAEGTSFLKYSYKVTAR